jgi:hypothetical protein
MTLSEAHGRIDHLEKELSSVISLLDSKRDRVKLLIANIDEAGQSLRAGSLGKRAASKMIMDLLPRAKDLRGSLNGVIERCEIALKGEE